MNRKAKLPHLFLALMMIFTFSACGANGSTTAPPSEPAPSQNEPDTQSGVPNEVENNSAAIQGDRRLKITLDGTEVITAMLVESPATEEFIAQLPITLNMTDYINREKHAPLSFSIGEDKLLNIQQEYEIGDIIYYPPGPTFAMYYDHDGNIIRAGFELLARLDQAGVDTLSEYVDAVEVTVELGD